MPGRLEMVAIDILLYAIILHILPNISRSKAIRQWNLVS